MEVKAVVAAAKLALDHVMGDEELSNVGLEEIEFDERSNSWNVTLGFSRPWNSARGALVALGGEPLAKRTLRVVQIDDATGRMIALRKPNSLVE